MQYSPEPHSTTHKAGSVKTLSRIPAPPVGDLLETTSRRSRSLAIVLMGLFRARAERGRDPAAHALDVDQEADAELWQSVGLLLAELADTAAAKNGDQAGAASDAELTRQPARIGGEPDVAQLADDLARLALDVDFENLIDRHEHEWHALLDSVRRRTSSLDGPQDEEDTLDVYAKLLTALPSELKRDFRRFAESHALDTIVERNAAFELGRRVERRLAPLQRNPNSTT